MSEPERPIAEAFIRGTHLLRAGLCDEALLAFRSVYKRAEAAADADRMAACLCEIAWSYYRLGDAEQGLQSAMSAKNLWERLGNRVEMARAMAVEAILCLDLGFSDEAYDLSTEALDIAETAGDPAMLAFALNGTGMVLTAGHEAELGADLLERAVAIADGLNSDSAEAYYLLNLGLCHARLAEEAEASLDPTRAVAERHAAIEFGDWAIERAGRCRDHWTLRTALGNSAALLALEGSFDTALEHLDKAAHLPSAPDTKQRLDLLQITGDVLFRAGRLDEARVIAAEALELADAANQIDHQVRASGKLAEILEALGDIPAALALHKRFHALYVRQFATTAARRARVEALRAESSHRDHIATTAWPSPLTEADETEQERRRA